MTQTLPSAAILLDLDGTLTDPREGIVGCIKYALKSVGVNIPVDEELASFIGPPLHESLTQLLGSESDAHLRDAITFYRERFTTRGMFENRVYPGISETLNKLRESGAFLYVATSKPQPFAERILEYFDLRRFFHGVYGSDLDGTRSNKADLIAFILEREGLSAPETAMIGDRAQDITGATANGIFAIGALWGYGSREELMSAGAAALCDEPGRLSETVSFNYPFNPTRAMKPARTG